MFRSWRVCLRERRRPNSRRETFTQARTLRIWWPLPADADACAPMHVSVCRARSGVSKRLSSVAPQQGYLSQQPEIGTRMLVCVCHSPLRDPGPRDIYSIVSRATDLPVLALMAPVVASLPITLFVNNCPVSNGSVPEVVLLLCSIFNPPCAIRHQHLRTVVAVDDSAEIALPTTVSCEQYRIVITSV